MDLDLTAEGVAALEARTEGWIAGLQLVALSMRGGLVTLPPALHRLPAQPPPPGRSPPGARVAPPGLYSLLQWAEDDGDDERVERLREEIAVIEREIAAHRARRMDSMRCHATMPGRGHACRYGRSSA